MLGWSITIKAVETPFVLEAPTRDPAELLGQWDLGLWGREWIDELVEAGKAKRDLTREMPFGHCRYMMPAKVLIPMFLDNMPEILDQTLAKKDRPFGGWLANVTIDRQKIAECPPDREILMEAWDLS
jgi:hypothetical protein